MINFHKRTLIKGITWEGSGLITLFLASITVLPDALTASIFTIAYTAMRVGMYYLHERIWKKTSWCKPNLDVKKDENG